MLRSKLILTSIILFIGSSCWSQEFYLGLRGGYNKSSLNSEPLNNPIELKDRHGWNIALTYTLESDKLPIGLTIETGYVLKGGRVNVDSMDYKFHYFNLPILLDIYPIEKLKISVGPELSYLAKATNIKNGSTKESILDTYNKRWELSGSASVSYSISFFADLGVKYNRSFTHVSNVDPILDRKNLYNKYLQIFLLLKIAN